MKRIAFILFLLLIMLSYYTPALATCVPTPVACSSCTCAPGLPTWIPIVNTILQIISTILRGVLAFLMLLLLFGSRFNIFGSCIRRFHKKSPGPKKSDCHDKEKGCDKKEDKDFQSKHQNGYCQEKYDPSKGYSLDCNHKKSFPYYNNYNNYF